MVIPGWIDTDGSIAFFKEALHMEPAEVMRKFELWACTKKRGKPEGETLSGMQKECAQIILDGLSKLNALKFKIETYAWLHHQTGS